MLQNTAMSAVPVLGSAGNPGAQSPDSKSQTNLIVNYLPSSMSDDDVKNLFSTVGQVQSCKVIREKGTNISLGYAFINYGTAKDAEKAILKMNGLPLQQKTIKVSYARPSSNTIKNANLYVAYLPKTFTQLELEEMFGCFGSIITSKILMEPGTEISRGVGFVRYDKHTEAENAITALNGKVIPGAPQPILVKFANQTKTNPTVAQAAVSMQTISSLAALTRRVNPMMQAAAAGGGGPIRQSVLPNMRFNPVSVGTGVGGAMPPVGLAPTPATCIFIYNLPENAEDGLLYQLFCPFGAITSVKVIKDKEGKCKRYGFVNMVHYDESLSAISALNGLQIEGKQLQVSFKKHD